MTLITPESLETSLVTYFVPLFRGELGEPEDHERIRRLFQDTDGASFFPFVETVDDYVALAVRIVRDPELRRRVGIGCRTIVAHYLRDEDRMTRSTASEILAMIAPGHKPRHARRSRDGSDR